jgi:serine protease Do
MEVENTEGAMKRNFVGGLALVALGATGAFVASNIQVRWGHGASAAPTVTAEVKATLPPPSREQVADAKMLSRTFAQVAAQVGPSVVRISITKTVKGGGGFHMRGNPFSGTPFERFFGGPGGPGDDDDEENGMQPQGPKQHGMGSGVVIDPKGYILTNNHVVEGADEVKVAFVDGKEVKGKVVGTDPKSDLAVVKVDGVDVKVARIGDSDKMDVGEYVMAIGNPFGLDHTVTVGVLSAKNRSGFQSGHYEDFLQTDASINPGNSGGPLVNLNGEVIGINTMIAGIGTGIGFAVPSSMAGPISQQLIKNGKVKRPFLGIAMQDITPEIQKSLGGKAPDKGALVGQITPGSPAEKAGVKPGDVITTVDGKSVDGSKAVQRDVLGKQIGQKIDLGLWRDGKDMHLSATTAELPGEKDLHAQMGGGSSPKAKLGIGMQPLTPELAERLGVHQKRGVVIASVREGSPAAEAGLREGDVLLEVDRHGVGSPDEAAKLLTVERPGGHLMRVQRGDAAIFVVVGAQ